MSKLTSLNSELVKMVCYSFNRHSCNIMRNYFLITGKTRTLLAGVRIYKSNSSDFVNKSLVHVHYLNRSFSPKAKPLDREHSRAFLFEELENRLRSQSLCSHDDWKRLHKICSKNKPDSVFAVEVLSFCIEKKWFALGKSLMDYLDSCNSYVTLAVLARYVRLCGECSDEVNEEYIFNLVNKIKEIAPVLDSNSTADVIVGLAVTSRWKECFQLMNPNKISSHPTPQMFSAVITAAFKNSEFSLAWKYLETSLNFRKPPRTDVCLKWINVFEEEKKTNKRSAEEHMLILMNLFKKFNVKMPKICIEKIKNFVSKNKWRGEYVSIPPSGECNHCKNTLESNVITKTEFEYLRNSFMDDVLIREDIFLTTTPKELEGFKNFIEKTAPFDYVLDGLNIAYHGNSLSELKQQNKTAKEREKQLCDFVHELVLEQNKKVLVVGKQQMLKWKPEYLNPIRKMAHLFITDNLSRDDPYILYATMYSGLGTKFISGDFYGDHKSLMKHQDLKDLFRRWQLLHQINFKKSKGKIVLMKPIVHRTSLQITENSIHIPCSFDDKLMISLNPPEKWLCLKKIHTEIEQKKTLSK